MTVCQLEEIHKCLWLLLEECAKLTNHLHEALSVVQNRMHERTLALLVLHRQISLELYVHLEKRQVAIDGRFNQVSLLVWLHSLGVGGVVTVPPVLLRAALCRVKALYPVSDEQVLVLLRLWVEELRKVPLVGVGTVDLEVEEAFLRRLCDPVEAKLYWLIVASRTLRRLVVGKSQPRKLRPPRSPRRLEVGVENKLGLKQGINLVLRARVGLGLQVLLVMLLGPRCEGVSFLMRRFRLLVVSIVVFYTARGTSF
jgi:hypothetical protein